MSKKVLFSPVGGTDPISQDNCFDGSMLHVCRHFKPDTVYLYLSKEMLDFEEKDHRYTEAIKLLSDKQNHPVEVKLISRPKLTDPHNFNYFFEDFNNEIKAIVSSLDEDDELLINISSGTPGMKSALNVMSTLGEFRCTCIQVSNPDKRMGEHTHRNDFDLMTLWELDPDNEDSAENRCSLVKCPNLLLLKEEQNIKSFLRQYDYHAAYSLAKELEKTHSKEAVARYIDYLEFAKERSAFKNVSSLEHKLKDVSELLPISGPNRPVFEYALLCDLKWKRGELSDFVRSLSPLIQELFLRVVDENIYPVSAMLIKDANELNPYKKTGDKNKRPEGGSKEVWDLITMEGLSEKDDTVKAILNVFKEGFKRSFNPDERYSNVTSESLCKIIEKLGKNDELKNDIIILRHQVESTIRNLLAHKIVNIDEDWIKRATGNLNEEQIMKMLKKVFRYTDVKVKDEYWNSYDRMNDFIIAKIDGFNKE